MDADEEDLKACVSHGSPFCRGWVDIADESEGGEAADELHGDEHRWPSHKDPVRSRPGHSGEALPVGLVPGCRAAPRRLRSVLR